MSNAPLPLTAPDWVCDSDVDPLGAETTSDLANLIQDVTHLLLELPGTNPDDPKRGIGIDLYLSGSSVELQTLPGLIEAQLGEDDRIDEVKCELQYQDDVWLIQLSIAVSGRVLGLQFGYSSSAGLVLQSQSGV